MKKQLVGLIILQLFLVYALYNAVLQNKVSVNFLDVFQGDSIFIETSEGYQVLIDGGPDERVIAQLEKVMPYFDRSIDLVVLTHPDKDHMYGIIDVIKRFKVENILLTDVRDNNAAFFELMGLLQEKNIRVIYAQKNRDFKLGSLVLDVLWPAELFGYKAIPDNNDSSIVIMARGGGFKILLTGDMGINVEKELLENRNLKADVLKVGHHGSKNSSSMEFLNAVKPSFAVIQVGKTNNYGHPHPEVIKNLYRSGVSKIYRTDLNGIIKFEID